MHTECNVRKKDLLQLGYNNNTIFHYSTDFDENDYMIRSIAWKGMDLKGTMKN